MSFELRESKLQRRIDELEAELSVSRAREQAARLEEAEIWLSEYGVDSPIEDFERWARARIAALRAGEPKGER